MLPAVVLHGQYFWLFWALTLYFGRGYESSRFGTLRDNFFRPQKVCENVPLSSKWTNHLESVYKQIGEHSEQNGEPNTDGGIGAKRES